MGAVGLKRLVLTEVAIPLVKPQPPEQAKESRVGMKHLQARWVGAPLF